MVRHYKNNIKKEKDKYASFLQDAYKTFIGYHPHIYEAIYAAINCNYPVLITGPTGTGKELIAQIIRHSEKWKDRSYQSVECSLITRDLLYSELFGHKKGSFTGATSDKNGAFKLANNGILFLDEVGDLSPDAQTGLLRVLQTGEIRPIGASKTENVNVRVIAATNQNVVNRDIMRPDLFYRLNVISIKLNPLKMEREIIPHLLKQMLTKLGMEKMSFHFYAYCLTNDWDGNIRELENFCKAASVNQTEKRICFLKNIRDSQLMDTQEHSIQNGFSDSDERMWLEIHSISCLPSVNNLPNYFNFIDYALDNTSKEELEKDWRVHFETMWGKHQNEEKMSVHHRYNFYDVDLKDIPDFSADDYTHVDKKTSWEKLGIFYRQVHGILQCYDSYSARSDVSHQEVLFEAKEQSLKDSYWKYNFDRYWNLSNTKLALKTGVSDGKIHNLREKYFPGRSHPHKKTKNK